MKRLLFLAALAPMLAQAQTITSGAPPLTVLAAANLTCCGGSTSETNVAALRVPGGSIGPNGAVDVRCLFNYPNSANNKVFNIRFSTSAGVSGAGPAVTTATTTAIASLWVQIRNAGATNSQVIYNVGATVPFGASANSPVTTAVDTTADTFINIDVTTASGAETVTVNSCVATVFRA